MVGGRAGGTILIVASFINKDRANKNDCQHRDDSPKLFTHEHSSSFLYVV
jgi:hypothetical protein